MKNTANTANKKWVMKGQLGSECSRSGSANVWPANYSFLAVDSYSAWGRAYLILEVNHIRTFRALISAALMFGVVDIYH